MKGQGKAVEKGGGRAVKSIAQSSSSTFIGPRQCPHQRAEDKLVQPDQPDSRTEVERQGGGRPHDLDRVLPGPGVAAWPRRLLCRCALLGEPCALCAGHSGEGMALPIRAARHWADVGAGGGGQVRR